MLRFLLKTPSAVVLVCALFSVRADLLYSRQSSEHPTSSKSPSAHGLGSSKGRPDLKCSKPKRRFLSES
jgi:hypothetical protein